MRGLDLTEHVEHFRARVLADALQEATRAYWHRRADALEAAMPRPGDFAGNATRAQLEAQRARLAAAALACRQRAELSLGGRIE